MGLKILVIVTVICVGAFYVEPHHWIPFAPHGMKGVLSGVSAVFFAYIGFDAISTTAEECKNPQRDLPRGMIYTLVICTVLYALLALVLTGMVPYASLGVGDPLAFVFGPKGVNLPWFSGIIAFSAVARIIYGPLGVSARSNPDLDGNESGWFASSCLLGNSPAL